MRHSSPHRQVGCKGCAAVEDPQHIQCAAVEADMSGTDPVAQARAIEIKFGAPGGAKFVPMSESNRILGVSTAQRRRDGRQV